MLLIHNMTDDGNGYSLKFIYDTHRASYYSFGQFAEDTEYRSVEPRIRKLARRLVLTRLATAIKRTPLGYGP